MSPASAISRAAPAVSPATTAFQPCLRMILRHWPSAWMWLWTLADGLQRGALRAPSGGKWMGMKCSATMWSPEVGSRWWISATRPASEFSIGIMARSAAPLLDRDEAILEGRARDGLGLRVDLASRRYGNWRRARPGTRPSWDFSSGVAARCPVGGGWLSAGTGAATNKARRSSPERRRPLAPTLAPAFPDHAMRLAAHAVQG